MRLNIFNSLMGLCVATAAVSCSDGLVEDNLRPVGSESDMISFVVANENNATRGGSLGNRPCGGAILRSANDADSLFLNVEVADITDDPSTRAVDISGTNLPTELYMTCLIRTKENNYLYYFADELFKHVIENNVNIWNSETPHYWLTNDTHYKFYGYYASIDAKTGENPWVKYNDGDSDNGYVPSLEYTVQTDPQKQFDLTYYYPSISDPGVKDDTYNIEFIATSAYNKLVPLGMKHALSKICFKTGTIASTITEIQIRDIYTKGKLNLGTGEWSNLAGKNNVRLSGITVSENESPITPEDNSFMLLPGSILEDSELAVFIEGQDEPYTASLEDCEWEAGKQYTYTINIDPEKPKSELEIIIDSEYKTVDAHYVIAKATVKVPEGQHNKSWKLAVSANDDADVSIVRKGNPEYKDYESLYEDGYWLDKEAVKGVPTDISARGTNEIEGIGNQDFYIFIPENINEDGITRKIYINEIMEDNTRETLNIKVKDTDEIIKSIAQYAPAWTDGGFGWERIDDDQSAPWGFFSDEKRIYIYESETEQGESEKKDVRGLLSQVAPNYNYNLISYKENKFHNFYIVFTSDLSNLIDSEGNIIAYDGNNGLKNTEDLYNINFNNDYNVSVENAVIQCKRPNGKNGFRRMEEKDKQFIKDRESSNGTEFDKQMLSYILKKNKLYVEKFVTQDNSVTYVPTIRKFQWYLPAYKQFENIPSSVKDIIDPAACWSSTAVSDNESAYLGSGTSTHRKYSNKIIVCRNRE